MKGIGNRYIIALLSAIVVAMLVVPSIADYSGDHPLTIYEHGMVNDGGLIYEAVTDGSGYTTLNAMDPATYTQDITISIPDGKTVKTARLYSYYTWSKPDNGDYSSPGLPAEAEFTFNDGDSVICQNPSENILEIPNTINYDNGVVQYWDSKGQGYLATTYDVPSGTFALDVTDQVTGSGTYTATITNADSSPTAGEYFVTFGFGLLVVYENANPEEKLDTEYWIAEGCDYLMARDFETPEDATTSAIFDRELKGKKATLTTVLTASNGGLLEPPQNMVYFNGDEIGPSTAAGYKHIGVNDFDVKLKKSFNIAEFQDRDDSEVVCNAFLLSKI